jgi:hypothetical protein
VDDLVRWKVERHLAAVMLIGPRASGYELAKQKQQKRHLNRLIYGWIANFHKLYRNVRE